MNKVLMAVMVICLGLVGSASALEQAANGLVGYWSLDGNADDASIYGNDGVIMGDPVLGSGEPNAVKGQAYRFNRDGNDHIQIPNDPSFDITDHITMSVWIKVDGYDESWQTIFCRGDWSWRMARNGGDDDWVAMHTSGLSSNGPRTAITSVFDGQWHHFVGVWPGDGQPTSLYIDGVFDNASGPLTGSINTNGDDPVVIGGQIHNGGAPRRLWRGYIDEVAIWDRALTEAEILGIYNGGAPAAIVDWRASGPIPANDEDSTPRIVVDPDVTLQWAAGVGASPAIVSHSVYMGTDPDALSLVDNVPAAQTSLVVAGLTQDAIVYWRVDEHNLASTTDPNGTAIGAVWAFNADMRPQIVTQPVDTRGWEGETIQLSVVANNADSYQWVDSSGPVTDGGDISGATTDTLSIANVELADEDSFFCALTNTYGVTNTNTVQVAVKRMLAHWPLLEQSPGDPNVVDISGNGHDGWFVGDPFFTAEGLDLDGDGDYVETGKMASEIGIGGNVERTITCFAYVRAFDNGGLYNVGDWASTQDFSLRTLGSNNQWRVQYWGGDWDFNTLTPSGFTTNLPAFSSHNEWVWFAHVHDGTHTRIYANGSLLLDWEKTINTTDVQTFRLGFYRGSDELNGILRDMRIYSAAMTSQEVGELYFELTGNPGCESYPVEDISGPDGVPDCVVDFYDAVVIFSDFGDCLLSPISECP